MGCILGQGGHVINEMRRRTQADIRVYSKEDKPKCAAEDEELVQVTSLGNNLELDSFVHEVLISYTDTLFWLRYLETLLLLKMH